MLAARRKVEQAVCITGLERSFPEFSGNLRVSLETLLGARSAYGKLRLPLDAVADLFGVRPEHDPWGTVRVTLPILRAEAVQTKCGVPVPGWFSAYARTFSAKLQFAVSFVQSLCDLAVCEAMLTREEDRRRAAYKSVVRLRLDLAWETYAARLLNPAVPSTNVHQQDCSRISCCIIKCCWPVRARNTGRSCASRSRRTWSIPRG